MEVVIIIYLISGESMEDTTSRSGEDEAGDEQDDSGHAGPTTMPRSV